MIGPLQSPFRESSVASTLKSSFCKWQSSDPTMTAVEHDIAVLVTRKNICEAGSCSILGKLNSTVNINFVHLRLLAMSLRNLVNFYMPLGSIKLTHVAHETL